jgi:hypothetical protein
MIEMPMDKPRIRANTGPIPSASSRKEPHKMDCVSFKSCVKTLSTVALLAGLAVGSVSQAMAAPKPAQKDPARDVVITLTNGRTAPVVFFTVIGPNSQGDEPNLLKDALAPGKSVKVKAKALKGCTFNVAADLEDGTTSEASNLNLCKDATIKLLD